jgi:hypothetical protein
MASLVFTKFPFTDFQIEFALALICALQNVFVQAEILIARNKIGVIFWLQNRNITIKSAMR